MSLEQDKLDQFIAQMEVSRSIDYSEMCETLEIPLAELEAELAGNNAFRDEVNAVIKGFYYGLLNKIHKHACGDSIDSEPHLPSAKEMLKIYKSGSLTRPIETETDIDGEGEELDAGTLKRLGLKKVDVDD